MISVWSLPVEFCEEAGGRFIAEIPAIPGVMAYGSTKDEALAAVRALAARVIADRMEHNEPLARILEPAGS